MTTNRTLTDTELQALGRVVDHFGPDEFRHYKDDGNPHGHIAESLLALNHYTQKYRLERDDEAKGQAEEVAPTPDENDYGFNRDHPNGGKGGPDINWRWAKETVGLAALELNRAYKQFVVSDEGWETPSGSLQCAAKQLNEAMQRLGIADPDSDIPF